MRAPSVEQGMPSVQGLRDRTIEMRITLFVRWGSLRKAQWTQGRRSAERGWGWRRCCSEARRTFMKILIYCGAAVSLLLAVPAAAQNTAPTIQLHELTAQAQKKPPLRLNDQQRLAIQEALVTAH